mmetsp:Transcript_13880/g.40686  ORF Transcript_13880/g.40686 Transcript_13880/m.40686 type:complete len:304 (-) Transcript_13880:572-1483(-)
MSRPSSGSAEGASGGGTAAEKKKTSKAWGMGQGHSLPCKRARSMACHAGSGLENWFSLRSRCWRVLVWKSPGCTEPLKRFLDTSRRLSDGATTCGGGTSAPSWLSPPRNAGRGPEKRLSESFTTWSLAGSCSTLCKNKPVNLFPLRSTWWSRWGRDGTSGMGPPSMLPCSSRCWSLGSDSSDVGKVPVNLFSARLRRKSRDKASGGRGGSAGGVEPAPSTAGGKRAAAKLPERKLPERSTRAIRGRWASHHGTLPKRKWRGSSRVRSDARAEDMSGRDDRSQKKPCSGEFGWDDACTVMDWTR